MTNDFCVFIVTNGRPGNVITRDTLRACGYTGDIRIVIDNEDGCAGEYADIFGDEVVIFDKSAYDWVDTCDNAPHRCGVVYARNAAYDIAAEMGLRYFAVFDDDYRSVSYRMNNRGEFISDVKVSDLDSLFSSVLGFLKTTPCAIVALSQNGDFIGGKNSATLTDIRRRSRKCMNTFFCKTESPVVFTGRINEDVNAYIGWGGRGVILLTTFRASISQTQTQRSRGGLTGLYLDLGTYVKSFYTVLSNPSCVSVALMGNQHKRLHHRVSWDNAVPCIIREEHRRGD